MSEERTGMEDSNRGRRGDEGLHVLAAEIENVGRDIAEIKHLVKNIQQIQSLGNERLTRIEERYTNHAAAIDRTFSTIKEQETRIQRMEIEQPIIGSTLALIKEQEARIKQIEVEQPLTKVVRNYAIAGVLAVCGAVGALVWTNATKPQQVIVVDRDGSTTRIEPPKR